MVVPGSISAAPSVTVRLPLTLSRAPLHSRLPPPPRRRYRAGTPRDVRRAHGWAHLAPTLRASELQQRRGCLPILSDPDGGRGGAGAGDGGDCGATPLEKAEVAADGSRGRRGDGAPRPRPCASACPTPRFCHSRVIHTFPQGFAHVEAQVGGTVTRNLRARPAIEGCARVFRWRHRSGGATLRAGSDWGIREGRGGRVGSRG